MNTYAFFLYNFIIANHYAITNALYNYLPSTKADKSEIPLGLYAIVLYDLFSPDCCDRVAVESALVFSIKNSKCKIVALIEGCCAAKAKMFLFDQSQNQKLQKINGEDIFVGHSNLEWNKNTNTFTSYGELYKFNLRKKSITKIVNR